MHKPGTHRKYALFKKYIFQNNIFKKYAFKKYTFGKYDVRFFGVLPFLLMQPHHTCQRSQVSRIAPRGCSLWEVGKLYAYAHTGLPTGR